jgi:radical SAM superfamily enzyme YgiQ (UPF0313 family)
MHVSVQKLNISNTLLRAGQSSRDLGSNVSASPSNQPADSTASSRAVLRLAMIHAPDPVYAANQTYGAQFIPLWAYTLSAHIPNDGRFAIKLYDNRFDTTDEIGNADVYIYSGINQDCGVLTNICNALRARQPHAKHIIGGPISSSFDAAGRLKDLDAFDHLCIGDGEELIGGVLETLYAGKELPRIIRADKRFDLMKAKMFDTKLADDTLARYYGAVVEVSRGCPFLCEFCDIRTLPDNNRPHLKPPEVIVAELDYFARKGVKQILLACDNFIGDLRAAEELLDKIIEWSERTGFQPGLYTWLTINLYKLPRMMEKMRRAGFDMLFIGVESFDHNSLLETAKVQNTAVGLIEPLRTIQSYGFIVVAGLIFGFDSDSPASFDATLRGLEESALLSGDPSLLVALPGTPLYRRMKLSGRLRDIGFGLGGYKYQTNIRYLTPKDEIIRGYQHFVEEFVKGDYQYRRLQAYFDLLEGGNFIPLKRGGGFGSLRSYAKALLSDRVAAKQMAVRMGRFMLRPDLVWHAIRGLALVLKRKHIQGGLNYFQFWFFAWTNTFVKYATLSEKDFDIESVGPDFDIRQILPESYARTADEPIPQVKIDAQLRETQAQLRRVIQIKLREKDQAPAVAG